MNNFAINDQNYVQYLQLGPTVAHDAQSPSTNIKAITAISNSDGCIQWNSGKSAKQKDTAVSLIHCWLLTWAPNTWDYNSYEHSLPQLTRSQSTLELQPNPSHLTWVNNANVLSKSIGYNRSRYQDLWESTYQVYTKCCVQAMLILHWWEMPSILQLTEHHVTKC